MQIIIVENFGKELKQMRLHEHLTQIELSEKSGVRVATIIGIENENVVPTMPTIQKLLASFGNKYGVNYAIIDKEGNLTKNIPKRKKRF